MPARGGRLSRTRALESLGKGAASARNHHRFHAIHRTGTADVTVDPTDLADGLVQIVRLPSRFVLGGLAGVRLVGIGLVVALLAVLVSVATGSWNFVFA